MPYCYTRLLSSCEYVKTRFHQLVNRPKVGRTLYLYQAERL